MSNQEILEKAIQKAIDGGWKIDWIAKDAFRVWSREHYWLEDGTAGIDIVCKDYELSKPQEFIYGHDFAKALWGDEDGYELAGSIIDGKVWQNHLQQMVIADDPIQYLGENI